MDLSEDLETTKSPTGGRLSSLENEISSVPLSPMSHGSPFTCPDSASVQDAASIPSFVDSPSAHDSASTPQHFGNLSPASSAPYYSLHLSANYCRQPLPGSKAPNLTSDVVSQRGGEVTDVRMRSRSPVTVQEWVASLPDVPRQRSSAAGKKQSSESRAKRRSRTKEPFDINPFENSPILLGDDQATDDEDDHVHGESRCEDDIDMDADSEDSSIEESEDLSSLKDAVNQQSTLTGPRNQPRRGSNSHSGQLNKNLQREEDDLKLGAEAAVLVSSNKGHSCSNPSGEVKPPPRAPIHPLCCSHGSAHNSGVSRGEPATGVGTHRRQKYRFQHTDTSGSFNSQLSGYSLTSSLDSILFHQANLGCDAEEVLMNLGGHGYCGSGSLGSSGSCSFSRRNIAQLARIPVRFLRTPSQCKGISLSLLLQHDTDEEQLYQSTTTGGCCSCHCRSSGFNTDAASEAATQRSASDIVEVILESLKAGYNSDPEDMLLNLGFGGGGSSTGGSALNRRNLSSLARIPVRFLRKPSQVKGIDLSVLLRYEAEEEQLYQSGCYGYQGLMETNDSGQPPSGIAEKIIGKLKERELLRRHSLLSFQGRNSSLELGGELVPHHLANVPARFRMMDPNRPTFESLVDKVKVHKKGIFPPLAATKTGSLADKTARFKSAAHAVLSPDVRKRQLAALQETDCGPSLQDDQPDGINLAAMEMKEN